MARREHITKRVVDGLKPAPVEFIVWDTEIKRLGVRVRPTGGRVYILRLRIQGRQRWLTIGEHGDPWTPETAREEALRLLGLKAGGKNPVAERDTGKGTPSVEEFSKRYLRDHAEPHKKPRSLAEDRRNLKLHINPAVGTLRVDQINRADVLRFHLARKAKPTNANRCLALLSHMFTMAEKWGIRPDGSNPCRHVERFPEKNRERFLSLAELARIGKALADTESAEEAGPFPLAGIRLLLLTGARKTEILTLRWESVDLGRGTVRLPESKGGPRTVFLNAPAQKIFKSLPRVAGNPYVLPGLQSEARAEEPRHLADLDTAWRKVRKRAGLGDVHVHDLRHSFASVAVAGGASLPIIGALLGHTQAATTQRYAHLSADPLRAASDAIGSAISAALKRRPRRGADLVPIRAGRVKR